MFSTYDVKGFFYCSHSSSLLCRKYLDISLKGTTQSSPDLIVIMMNPGASAPCSSPECNLDDCNNLVDAVPDKTQFQLMAFMSKANLSFLRVFNLSDIREPNSTVFYSLIPSNLDSSIFHPSRASDFDSLFVKGVPVLCAWGVSTKLKPLVNLVNLKLPESDFTLFGLKNNKGFYFHPNRKGASWVNGILNEFNKLP